MSTSTSTLDRTGTPEDFRAAFATAFAAATGDVLHGRVVTPYDASWDTDRAAWNLSVDQQPVAVVVAASPADVVTTVRAARAWGLRVAPQGTGHNAGPLGPLDGTVLLKTSGMSGVQVDVARQTVRVQAGALWGAVTDAAADVGLAALAGSARDVGVVGYTLGGGVSWFARSHGLASGSLLAAEVVTADGDLLRVDEHSAPDLFWALRGGGGSMAVVTAVELALFRLSEVTAGALFWPVERASEVLHCWRAALPGLPEGVTSLGRLLRFPALPEIPEPFRGRSFVTVELVSQLGPAATDALLAPLRALGPELDTVRPTPVGELGALHMDPPGPTPVTGDGLLLAELPADALDAYLSVVGPGGDFALLTTEIRHLGGAATPGRVPGGALSGLAGSVLIYSGTITPDATSAAVAHCWLDALHATLAPWAAATTYGNFAERATPTPRFDEPTRQRLRLIEAAYDPTDLVRANHPITMLQD